MKSLVTGGAGFIVSHLVDDLIGQGHEVVVVDDLSGGFLENVNKKAKFVQLNINDYNGLVQLFGTEKFDYVFHLAAYAAEGLSHFIRKYNYQTNLLGSINLINLSVLHKVKRFVFTSSIAVYGANQIPMIETLDPKPEDPYGISKLAVEMDLKCAHEMFGLNYTIFRPHNVYGERHNIGDKYRNVIGIFMNKILKGESLTIFGDGSQTRAFTYVKDITPHMARCISMDETNCQVFNIGADKPYSLNELAKIVIASMGNTSKIEYTGARNEVVHAYSNHSKSKMVFKIKADTELHDGIAKMSAWVREHGSKSTSKFENIEILENLPSVWR